MQPLCLVYQKYVEKRKGVVKMHKTVLKMSITRKQKCDTKCLQSVVNGMLPKLK